MRPAASVGSIAKSDRSRRPVPPCQRQGPRAVWIRSRPPRPSADGRQRPHLHLRRGSSHADPGQGQGADRPVGLLVRADEGDRRQPPDLRHRGGAARDSRPGAGRAQAEDVAGGVRRARLHHRLRLEGLSGDRGRLGHRVAAGAARVRAAARADLHAEHQGRGRPRRGDRLRAGRRARRRQSADGTSQGHLDRPVLPSQPLMPASEG